MLFFHQRLAVAERILRERLASMFLLSEDDQKYDVEFEAEMEYPNTWVIVLSTSRDDDVWKITLDKEALWALAESTQSA